MCEALLKAELPEVELRLVNGSPLARETDCKAEPAGDGLFRNGNVVILGLHKA